ncbi:DUF2971 domain-containing protein [Bacillus sp. FDAARGOS_235]|uniref:DUF2971 domain-containing protein n=1 Tax=Bacillus sp. FDAARGOS_235 TaxID=1839798 RepID=UPI00119F8C4B|nr:DUF2971 domain-containing protein [Bacillus sp. FDAARGOS_235]
MPYTNKEWSKRIQYRTDLSGFVYHFTKPIVNDKGERELSAIKRLLKIIKERTLLGSSTKSGFITGNRKAICFQDAPIQGITQNIIHEQEYREELGAKTRYVGVGLAFEKLYIFDNGGRPVFYEQKDIAKQILPKEDWWRIVDFNLSNRERIIDWTHEREWRLPEDEFKFDLSEAIIILPNDSLYKYLMNHLDQEDLRSIRGIISLTPVLY